MKKNINVDRPLLIITTILCFIGAILVFSASWPTAVLEFGNGYHFILRHIRSLALGFAALLFAINFPYRYYKKTSVFIIFLAVALNLLLFTTLGKDKYGSTRWLDFKYLPSFMPSDVLKIASIIFISSLCSSLGKKAKKGRGLFLSVIFIGIFVGIVLIRDMGSAMVMVVALGSILIVSGIKFHNVLLLLGLGGGALYYTLTLESNAYRVKRIMGFLDPFSDLDGINYQLKNSLYGLAMGGISGVGLGKGVQKFSYIPHVYNDFIFAVMGEEFGLIGASITVILYFLFMWRGYLIAYETKDRFGKFLAAGLTTLIGVQAFIHIMVNIGIAPVTGITLPFISYGGTSLIITLYAAGIILNISKENNRRVKWDT